MPGAPLVLSNGRNRRSRTNSVVHAGPRVGDTDHIALRPRAPRSHRRRNRLPRRVLRIADEVRKHAGHLLLQRDPRPPLRHLDSRDGLRSAHCDRTSMSTFETSTRLTGASLPRLRSCSSTLRIRSTPDLTVAIASSMNSGRCRKRCAFADDEFLLRNEVLQVVHQERRQLVDGLELPCLGQLLLCQRLRQDHGHLPARGLQNVVILEVQ